MSQQMIQEGSDFVYRVMAGSFLDMYAALSTWKFDNIAVNEFPDITDPENWMEMKLFVHQ